MDDENTGSLRYSDPSNASKASYSSAGAELLGEGPINCSALRLHEFKLH